MHLEEVAQAHEGSDCLDISWRFGILDCLQLVLAWFDSFWHEGKSQVGNFLVSKHTFLQVDLEMVFVQSCQNLVQNLQMFLMGVDED